MVDVIRNDRKYTYEDYLTWNDGKRWEIIDGVVYLMSPAPTLEHQEILTNLLGEFIVYFKGKKCKVYPAPFDVRLPKKNEPNKKSSSTVQPDITIVCDTDKLDKKGCKGVPDLIVEVLSPSSTEHDLIRKFRLYEQSGVREYWVANPANQVISRFFYDDSLHKYQDAEYFSRKEKDIITSIIFPELSIKLEEVFPEVIKEDE